MTTIQKEIKETIEEIAHLQRVEEQLKTTKKELDTAYNEHELLDRKLRKELKDIAKLEGLSTKAIFHKILGNKEKQLEQERQEYLELSLKEEDTKKSIQILEYEVDLLEAKLGGETQLKKNLELLKIKREEEIIATDASLSQQLLKISNDLEGNYQFKVEIDEALEVGEVCRSLVRQMIGHLSKVRNWGQWPAQRNRHPMGRMMERDAMDRARNLSYQIKHHLNLFSNELTDLGSRIRFDFDEKQFGNFSNFFFNNIITDWIRQQQLTQALRSANELRSNIENVLSQLKSQKNETEQKIQSLNIQRDQILVS